MQFECFVCATRAHTKSASWYWQYDCFSLSSISIELPFAFMIGCWGSSCFVVPFFFWFLPSDRFVLAQLKWRNYMKYGKWNCLFVVPMTIAGPDKLPNSELRSLGIAAIISHAVIMPIRSNELQIKFNRVCVKDPFPWPANGTIMPIENRQWKDDTKKRQPMREQDSDGEMRRRWRSVCVWWKWRN